MVCTYAALSTLLALKVLHSHITHTFIHAWRSGAADLTHWGTKWGSVSCTRKLIYIWSMELGFKPLIQSLGDNCCTSWTHSFSQTHSGFWVILSLSSKALWISVCQTDFEIAILSILCRSTILQRHKQSTQFRVLPDRRRSQRWAVASSCLPPAATDHQGRPRGRTDWDSWPLALEASWY